MGQALVIRVTCRHHEACLMAYGYHFKTCSLCSEPYFTTVRGGTCRGCTKRPDLSRALTVLEYQELKHRLRRRYVKKKNERRTSGKVWHKQR